MKKNKKIVSLLLTLLVSTTGCKIVMDSSSSSINTNSSSSSSNSSSISTNSDSSSNVGATKLVYGIAKKASFTAHEDNKGEKENKKDEFFVRDSNYKVGDDNALSFLPVLTTLIPDYDNPEDSVTVVETEWNYLVKLEKLDDEVYKAAVLDDYTDSFDNVKCLFDFNEAAIGYTFKLSITPTGLTENQDEDKFTVEYVFDVTDGYNVTSAKELAYISNKTGSIFSVTEDKTHLDADAKAIWDEFKTNNNLLLDYYPSSMILHDNIALTSADIPSKYFYSEEEVVSTDADYGQFGYTTDSEGNKVIQRKVVGSLKDWLSIYYRQMDANSSFNFEGNFFKLDASSLPTVVREDNEITAQGKGNSHTELFYFIGDETNSVKFSNFKLDGNAPKNNDVALSGGLIFIKTSGTMNVAMENNISIRWFITYFSCVSKVDFKVDKCKLYDNFNCFAYLHGANLLIKDTEMKAAGGPAIIQNHVGLGTTDVSDDYTSNTTVTNSVIESKVTGTEGWFSIYNASEVVAPIKGMDALFNPFGRSFLTKGQSNELYFNLLMVNKDEAAETITANPAVRGSFKYEDYSFDYGTSNPYFGGFYQAMLSQPSVPPVFETNAGGYAYTDGATGLYDATQSQIIDPSNAMYKGDKMCLYFMGMAIVFDYGMVTA